MSEQQWQEMAARVARAEDRTMSAEAERDALRGAIEMWQREAQSGWESARQAEAALTAEREAHLAAYQAEVEREKP